MTAQQIVERVEQEADARFEEVIERLLRLLDARSDLSRFVKKWVQTGLLAEVSEEDMGEAAYALETTCLIILDEATKRGDPSWAGNEDEICRRLKESVDPYKCTPIGKTQDFTHHFGCSA